MMMMMMMRATEENVKNYEGWAILYKVSVITSLLIVLYPCCLFPMKNEKNEKEKKFIGSNLCYVC